MAPRSPTVLITGATSGLGRYLAAILHTAGWKVLAHGRSERKLAELTDFLGRSGGAGKIVPYLADLSDLSQVRQLADQVRTDNRRLHVLVNNAGVGFGAPEDPREVTVDGNELRLAVNYLAPVLLSQLLRPLLVKSAPARIVNIGSLGQARLDPADPQFTQGYDGTQAYRRAKLALACHTFDLAADLADSQVTVNCVHPATYMPTAMVLDSGVTPRSTLEEGGEAAMRLITGEGSAGRTGQFYDGLKPVRALADAYDLAYRQRLRSLTADLLTTSTSALGTTG